VVVGEGRLRDKLKGSSSILSPTMIEGGCRLGRGVGSIVGDSSSCSCINLSTATGHME
jgi:hypothetical protein